MARYTTLLLVFTSTALAVGCASDEPAAAGAGDLPAAAAQRDQSAQQTVTETVEPSNGEVAGVAVEVNAPIGAPRPRGPERILLLARGGPLLLDFYLTIGGRPYDEGLAALIEQVLRAGDTDGDGRATWSAWGQNQVFLQGELANLNPLQERSIRGWIKRFDENADDQLQPAEAASWLGRESGRSAAALTLRSCRSYLTTAATHSRLWPLLDADGNGQLSADELELVSRRLYRLDLNDNRILELSELATLRDQLGARTAQRVEFASQSIRKAAIHLDDRGAASQLDFVLSDLYAPRQQLGLASFPARAGLFTSLDSDGNQLLDRRELESMLDVEPHAQVSLDFAAAAETGAPVAKLTLVAHADDFDQVIQSSANRIALVTGDTRLILSAHDLSGSLPAGQIVARSQIALMVHDRGDALFATLDSNVDGRLGEREIAAAAERLRGCDADGDRQLAGDELPVSMTVAFLRSEPPGGQSFYVPNFDSALAAAAATSSGQRIDWPSWFRQADFNSDGDLSRREFIGSATQFSRLDTNRDGWISGDEAVRAGRSRTK